VPVVAISTDRLRQILGTQTGSEELAAAVDRLGCDLEELVEVILYACPACGVESDRLPREDPPRECDVCGAKSETPFHEMGRTEVVRLDLLPARPDLFDAAGLSRALMGYLGIRTGLPDYRVEPGEIVVTVDPSVDPIRREIACAEVEIEEDLPQWALVGLFQYQENLHWAVGRDRKKASIGMYDLETHGRGIVYTAETPDYRFTPLGMPGRELSLLEIRREHPKGVRYRHLLDGMERYPILRDAAGQVLSMPPIINSEETKVTRASRRFFIDVTGTDPRTVSETLALIVSSLCEFGATVRTVTIRRGDDETVTPDLTPLRATLDPERACRLIGVEMDRDEILGCLDRMRLGVANPGAVDGPIEVVVPSYRIDVKHEVDLIEDVAIAYGYHRLPSPLVPTMTVGEEFPERVIARGVSRVMIGLGFTEVMNFVLTNREEHCTRMRLPEELGQVTIENPISVHQEMVRTHLLAGMMATFKQNKTREMPQRLFEVGDVVRAREDGTDQRPHLAIGSISPRADFAEVRSVVSALLHEFGVSAEVAPATDDELTPVFLAGRVAVLKIGGRRLGVLGEVHPEVILAWGLDHPVVLAELDLSVLP
jgi:phenylalanyl-tRNA synthetase beta chain